MRKSVKDRWVRALRSGEYRQTQGVLRDEDSYCCLGVLCDLYRKTRKRGGWSSAGGFRVGAEEEGGALPHTVAKWAGLEGQDPIIGVDYATSLNDERGYSFKRIATLIEKNL